ncbi:Dolichyl-phosphate-mannose-protein mannosyltransferase [Gaiella occulta]|uniref:Dolichyl-phosphate-mannose-protein mannosyltransferase n=1 Tax=Gaiella occulta TaxID=1002870 RepID=A0A7M2YXI1_9ACTN|nr:glycosyltransferase family 39 protein [Gaiella occulta]RDI74289.1 Dolichyl-phosphate-mannose-protein mannosyltransferase [Gaiella occulta]
MPRSRAVAIVSLAAALPRLLVLAFERGAILENFVEKSDRFALTLVHSGTFGFLPGVPSGYTQPLYAFFLAALYWPFGHAWLAVGLAQTAVAVATALLVLEIGRRLRSTRVGLVAALLTTLHPYVVWHDVHVNREILDGFLLAAITLLALLAYERRSRLLAAATGAVVGLAVLGNSRLALLPLVLAAYVAWPSRTRRAALLGSLAVLVAAAAVVAPWAVRNEKRVGCLAITTDTRALWKANNLATYDVLKRGQWIDDVPELAGVPPWPERAADIALRTGRPVHVDECAQSRFYQRQVLRFWRDHPGEKARLAAQATWLLWQPTFSVATDDAGRKGIADTARRSVEPMYMIVIYALAIAGCFFAPRRFLALAVLLESYNTLMAMVFAGTVRYRVPWDFLLALLAAFAVERLWRRARGYSDAPARPSALP